MAQPTETLSAREARRTALVAQGLLGPRPKGGPAELVRHLGGVQIDTISVLARNHELVQYARLGAVGRERVEDAYWGPGSHTFEYWSHAACILPLEDWPAYGFQRRARLRRGRRWHHLEEADRICALVVDRLKAEGPLTANGLGGAKKGGPWWDWSEVKIAAEWLLDIGTIVCRERRGFQRVYDLACRAVPGDLHSDEWSDDDCRRYLIGRAGRQLGVATAGDLAVYHGMDRRNVERLVAETDLQPVAVEGWKQPAYISPAVLGTLGGRLASRSTLVSPFDSLLWDRPRTERLFGVTLRLEAYTPRPKRVFGYFGMPVLSGDQLVGLVDPAREGATFVARNVRVDRPADTRAVAGALREAAEWVGCDRVVIEQVAPIELGAELQSLVAREAEAMIEDQSPQGGRR